MSAVDMKLVQRNYIMNHSKDFKYDYQFFFERKFYTLNFIENKSKWIHDNWHRSIYISIVYVILVFSIQYLMKNREKYRLNKALIAWNLVLSLFSLFGVVRSWPHFLYVLRKHGVEYSICERDFAYGVQGCWTWLFILSKVPELVDTLFVVLRKQKLIFLHWYHHSTVLIYCWYSSSNVNSTGRWFVVMNYTIHSVMYGYYACRALRFKIPKWVNIFITTGQISQMVVGIFVNTLAYFKKNRGERCETTYENIYWSFFMYFTYFLLFFQFFCNAYLVKSSKIKSHDDKKQTQTKHKKSN